MGCSRSSTLHVPYEDLTVLNNTTKFTRSQIDHLYFRFREFGAPKKRVRFLIKRDFNSGHMNGALHSLIFNEMFGDKHRISFVDFATFLHIFKALGPRATVQEQDAMKIKKLKLLFTMYDINKDGEITNEDLLNIVHRLFADYANFRTMVSMVHTIMNEMTQTHRILFEDFCVAMKPFDMDDLAVKFPGA